MSNSKDFENLPATHKLVDETRSELKSDIASLRAEMQAGFKSIDARFSQVDSRFNQIDSRFNQIEGRFSQTDARLDKLVSIVEDQNSKIHRVQALFEDMVQQNKMMLDSMTINNDRIEKIEKAIATQ